MQWIALSEKDTSTDSLEKNLRAGTLNEELETLNEQARKLEAIIAKNAVELLES